MSTPEHTSIPDVVLEQYAVGELESDELAAIDRQLEQDPALAARLQALQQSNEAILAVHPPAAFAAAVESRLHTGSNPAASPRSRLAMIDWRPRWVVFGPVLAAAAILMALFLPSDVPSPESVFTTPAAIREKGLRPHLNVYRQQGETAELLTDGAVAHPGDVIQVAYVAAGATHGVVISIDGNGVVTLHHPPKETESTELEESGEIPIPHAYRLDDAPDFERFVLVSGAVPVRVRDVVGAAEAIAADPERARQAPVALPGTLQQYSIIILKEVPR